MTPETRETLESVASLVIIVSIWFLIMGA